MKLIETKISETTIHMRYADSLDNLKAIRWIDFQVPLTELRIAEQDVEVSLGNIEKRHLGVIRLAALRYMQDIIGVETQRLIVVAE